VVLYMREHQPAAVAKGSEEELNCNPDVKSRSYMM